MTLLPPPPAACDYRGPGACSCARGTRLEGVFTAGESAAGNVDWTDEIPHRRRTGIYWDGELRVLWIEDAGRFVLYDGDERLACTASWELAIRAAEVHAEWPRRVSPADGPSEADVRSADPLARARAFIAASQWRFASTMPDIPHEYTVRGRTAGPPAEFDWMVRQIRAEGFEAAFHQRTYMYWVVDDHKYWTMGAPVDQTTIINRERVAPGPPGGRDGEGGSRAQV